MTRTKPDSVPPVLHRGNPWTTCRSCAKPITFARTTNGKDAPFEIDPNGKWTLENGSARFLGDAPPAQLELGVRDPPPRYTNHFATCPHALNWRSK